MSTETTADWTFFISDNTANASWDGTVTLWGGDGATVVTTRKETKKMPALYQYIFVHLDTEEVTVAYVVAKDESIGLLKLSHQGKVPQGSLDEDYHIEVTKVCNVPEREKPQRVIVENSNG